MKNIIQKVKNNPLKALVVMVLIYPVLPLALLSGWFFVIVFKSILTVESISNSKDLTLMFASMIWLLGGPAGLLGGIMAVFNKQTIMTLLFLVYGAISYSIIALVFVFETLKQHESVWYVLHSLYISLTLLVIAIQIIRVYKNLNLPWREQVVKG